MNIISRFNSPKGVKILFILDGIGALLSAFMLAIILPKLEPIIGIPSEALQVLATFAVLIVIYDVVNVMDKNTKLKPRLRAVAHFNIVYILLSIAVVIYYNETVSFWGWAYFIGELTIIAVLAIVEKKTSDKI